jgi:hypothetical protein
MKKIAFIIATFITVISFTACKKSSSGGSTSPAALVGTWEATSLKTTTTINGFAPVSYDTTYTHGHSVIEIFNADSTGGIIDDTQTPPDTTMGIYYVSRDSIYTQPTGQGYYTFDGTFSVSGTTLKIVNSSTYSSGPVSGTVTGTMTLVKQ